MSRGSPLLLFLLICLSPSLWAEELPSVPLSPQETALWRDQGFSAEIGGEWQYYGISPAEAREWLAAGIEYPGWANQWKSEGFRASEAARWKGLTNVYTAAGFLKAGFGPAEAKVWLDSGVQSSLRATEYRALGMDAATGAGYWRLGIYPEQAGPWFQAGFDPGETQAWRWGPKDVAFYHTAESSYSQAVYRLEAAVEWRRAGFTAEQAHRLSGFQVELDEARSWLALGFSAEEIMAWRDSGFSPAEAWELRDEGFTPEEAEANRFEKEWVGGDELTDLDYDLELMADGRLEVVVTLTLSNRPGGVYGEEFILPLPGESELRYGRGHYRTAAPSYRIKNVAVDGAAVSYRRAEEQLAIPLSADGLARTIRIAYTTDDRILSFPHHDELSFAPLRDLAGVVIRRATVAVRLVPGAEVVFTDGEAGLPGRRDLVARVEETPAGKRVVFVATRVLREKMGLRVNVAFTKGNVKPGWLARCGSLDRRAGRALTGLVLFLGGVLLSTAYFLVVWHRYGRDPREVVSLQKSLSPGKLSPAEARLFQSWGRVDGVSLIATLIHLAQRGALTISESGGEYTISREQGAEVGLFPPEAACLAALFADGAILVLSGRAAGARLKKGLRALRGVLKENFGNYYRTNLKYLLPGALVSTLAVVVGVRALRMDDFGEMAPFRIFFALVLTLLALVQLLFFKHLLKAPSEALLRQRDLLFGYRRYLETDLKLSQDLHGYLTPTQESHLAHALALGLPLGTRAIRRGQARWFTGRSGPFVVGDFASALRRLGRSFRS